MKIRSGFVANSSSASFIIIKMGLNKTQIEKIFNHSQIAKKMNMQYAEDAWRVDDQGDTLIAHTLINNFDFREYLRKINIPDKNIKRGPVSQDKLKI